MAQLTKKLIHAAAMDAAERSKRKRRVATMDDEASEAYHAEHARLFALIGGVEGWIDLPNG
jgi:hypothetical protein